LVTVRWMKLVFQGLVWVPTYRMLRFAPCP
jgi:hypothetical protein